MTKETEKKKQELIEQLTRTPIVQLACERCDVGRSTYYKWRKEDKVFGRTADHALEAGVFRVNDIAESKLLKLINNDNLTAIIFWLKHNHPKYANVNRLIHEYTAFPPDLSLEEKNIITQEIAKMMALKNRPKFTVEETKELIEQELTESGDIEPVQKKEERVIPLQLIDPKILEEQRKEWVDYRRKFLESIGRNEAEVEAIIAMELKKKYPDF